jgi:hypothetical protein
MPPIRDRANKLALVGNYRDVWNAVKRPACRFDLVVIFAEQIDTLSLRALISRPGLYRNADYFV